MAIIERRVTYKTVPQPTKMDRERDYGPACWKVLDQMVPGAWDELPWVEMTYVVPSDYLDDPNAIALFLVQLRQVMKWVDNHEQPFKDVVYEERQSPPPSPDWAPTDPSPSTQRSTVA